MLVFEERGKPEHREKKPLEAELSHALTCLSSNKEKKNGCRLLHTFKWILF